MTHDSEGNVLDVGRKTRSIPPAIRRALDARDKTCRFPGCNSRFVQAHHVEHWANGGERKLSNLLNLCHWHHHCVHDGGYRVELVGKREATFYDPMGRLIRAVPPLPKLEEKPNDTLRNRNVAKGLDITGDEGHPKWGYAPVNLSYALDGMWHNARLRREGRL
jgi:hypothetical protein